MMERTWWIEIRAEGRDGFDNLEPGANNRAEGIALYAVERARTDGRLPADILGDEDAMSKAVDVAEDALSIAVQDGILPSPACNGDSWTWGRVLIVPARRTIGAVPR